MKKTPDGRIGMKVKEEKERRSSNPNAVYFSTEELSCAIAIWGEYTRPGLGPGGVSKMIVDSRIVFS